MLAKNERIAPLSPQMLASFHLLLHTASTAGFLSVLRDDQEPKRHFDLKYLASHPVVVLRYMPRTVYSNKMKRMTL